MTDQPQSFLPMELPKDEAQPPMVYREGRYTLDRVPEATQRAIIALRAGGYSIHDVASLLRCHTKTVMAVDRWRPEEIATRKEMVGAIAMQASDMAFAAVRERLSDPVSVAKTSLKDLALTGAIAADKGLLLGGEATSRVAVVLDALPGHAAFAAELARMGLGAGTRGQKGAPGREPIEVVAEVGPAAGGGTEFTDDDENEGACDE